MCCLNVTEMYDAMIVINAQFNLWMPCIYLSKRNKQAPQNTFFVKIYKFPLSEKVVLLLRFWHYIHSQPYINKIIKRILRHVSWHYHAGLGLAWEHCGTTIKYVPHSPPPPQGWGGGHSPHDWLRTRVQKSVESGCFYRSLEVPHVAKNVRSIKLYSN